MDQTSIYAIPSLLTYHPEYEGGGTESEPRQIIWEAVWEQRVERVTKGDPAQTSHATTAETDRLPLSLTDHPGVGGGNISSDT